MFFEVNGSKLDKVSSDWLIKELELENLLISREEEGAEVLSQNVLGEELLLINNQVRTKANKRADILAMDKQGNAVIVELKKDDAWLGVEMQALQYLADFSHFSGQNFIDKFAPNDGENIKGFLGSEVNIEDLNKRQRIILVARGFDETLFSMGEWLSSKGVGFRCIAYTPIEVQGKRFISFEVAFERNPNSLFGLSFTRKHRQAGVYWHNISEPNNDWWQFLKQQSVVPACFDEEINDVGHQLLNSYVPGDRIIAYARGYGALGWAEVTNQSSYTLVDERSKDDANPTRPGCCRHRLTVKWHDCAENLDDAIRASEVRKKFNIYHPLRTSVGINVDSAEMLIEEMHNKFSCSPET